MRKKKKSLMAPKKIFFCTLKKVKNKVLRYAKFKTLAKGFRKNLEKKAANFNKSCSERCQFLTNSIKSNLTKSKTFCLANCNIHAKKPKSPVNRFIKNKRKKAITSKTNYKKPLLNAKKKILFIQKKLKNKIIYKYKKLVSLAKFNKSKTYMHKLDKKTLLMPAMLFMFLAVFVVQQQHLENIMDEKLQLEEQNKELMSQNNFYKKAYEVTLDDIKSLSKNYGGQDKYVELAEDLRQKEIEAVLEKEIKKPESFLLKNTEIWKQFVQQGVIDINCLSQPIRIDTVQEHVLITTSAASLKGKNSDLQLYVDANFITEIPLEENHQLTLTIPDGTHIVDFVSKAGNLKLEQVMFDTVPLPLENATIDEGLHWNVFDCTETSLGNTMKKPGAIRFHISKL